MQSQVKTKVKRYMNPTYMNFRSSNPKLSIPLIYSNLVSKFQGPGDSHHTFTITKESHVQESQDISRYTNKKR